MIMCTNSTYFELVLLSHRYRTYNLRQTNRKLMNPRYLTMTTFLFLLVLPALATAISPLSFENAWIAEAPPASKVMAAYVNIHNSGASAREITAVMSPCFENIEIHLSVNKNGIASMRHQPTLVIPASGTIKLEPGGYHMMLFNPKRELKSGNQCELNFKLINNKILSTTAIVKKF